MKRSKQLMEMLQQLLLKEPLKQGELRRIPGMGSHRASLSPTHEGKTHFFSIEIGGKPIYIYK